MRGKGSQAASRARLQEARWFPRLRATPCALTLAGRGQEGSESWPVLPLTQCRKAGEGRRTYRGCPSLSSWERDTGTCRSAPCRHPLPTSEDSCFREAAGPTTHSPAEASCGMRKGTSSSFRGVWSPGVSPFAAPWQLCRGPSQRCILPPAPCQCREAARAELIRRTPRVPRKRVGAAPQAGREKVDLSESTNKRFNKLAA